MTPATGVRLRIWHLVVAVVASAVLLGVARAMVGTQGFGRAPSASSTLFVALVAGLLAIPLFVFARFGWMVGRELAGGAIDWGKGLGRVGRAASLVIAGLTHAALQLTAVGLSLVVTAVLLATLRRLMPGWF